MSLMLTGQSVRRQPARRSTATCWSSYTGRCRHSQPWACCRCARVYKGVRAPFHRLREAPCSSWFLRKNGSISQTLYGSKVFACYIAHLLCMLTQAFWQYCITSADHCCCCCCLLLCCSCTPSSRAQLVCLARWLQPSTATSSCQPSHSGPRPLQTSQQQQQPCRLWLQGWRASLWPRWLEQQQ